MSIRRTAGALLAAPLFGLAAAGQVPVAPPVPALPAAFAPVQASPFPAVSAPLTAASPISAPLSAAPAAVGIAPAPPPPGPPTLGQFLGLSYQQREYRQRRLARTPIGQLREKVQTPLSKLTGGLIPPFPPKTPTLAELQAPGPIGAAAKGKLDRETAADRIKAVEYLGTLDCHYWPEAEEGLVGALRADRNEWVRLAAAQTLGKGCCCTKKTITALSIVVNCSMEDGNPVEKSPKVIAAAQAALARCLAMACACDAGLPIDAVPVVPDGGGPVQDEKPAGETVTQAAYAKPGPAGYERGPGGLPAAQIAKPTGMAYYERAGKAPWGQVIAAGRTALSNTPKVPADVMLAGASRDLELSGIDLTAMASAESPRPANLLDMLLGESSPDVKPAMVSMTLAPGATLIEPAVAVLPAPTVTAAVKPTIAPKAAAVPARVTPAAGIAPAVPAAKPAVVPAAAVAPKAARTARAVMVADLIATKADPRQIETEADQLAAADFQSPGLDHALLTAAEDHKDPWVRAACIRALGRGKVSTPGVIAGLERLQNDRMTTVRVDAAVALTSIRGK